MKSTEMQNYHENQTVAAGFYELGMCVVLPPSCIYYLFNERKMRHGTSHVTKQEGSCSSSTQNINWNLKNEEMDKGAIRFAVQHKQTFRGMKECSHTIC